MPPGVMLPLELPPAVEQGSPAGMWVGVRCPEKAGLQSSRLGTIQFWGQGWRSVFLPLASSQQKDPNGPHCLKNPAIFPRKLLERPPTQKTVPCCDSQPCGIVFLGQQVAGPSLKCRGASRCEVRPFKCPSWLGARQLLPGVGPEAFLCPSAESLQGVCSAWRSAKNKRSARTMLGEGGFAPAALAGRGFGCQGPLPGLRDVAGQRGNTTHLLAFFCFFSPLLILCFSKDQRKHECAWCVLRAEGARNVAGSLEAFPSSEHGWERPLRESRF